MSSKSANTPQNGILNQLIHFTIQTCQEVKQIH